VSDRVDLQHERDAAAGEGRRPLVQGIPVVLGAAVLIAAAIVLILVITRDAGLPSDVAADYVAMMAGSLAPRHAIADPLTLSRALALSERAFTPRVPPLGPEFTLLGGAHHTLRDRPAAVWFYRDARSEQVLGQAFVGTLAELGTPEHVRSERAPALHVFYKTTQTLVFWQEGPLVYALVATLPSERTIGLARRAADGSR
jgi:hypothetical protein